MTMEYKGYTAGPIDFDPDDGTFSGVVLGLKDVIHFEGTNAAELRASFEGGIDDYLAWCQERDKAPERPYSGNFLLRMTPDLHRRIAIAAAQAGKSLNAFVTEALERRAG